MDLGLEKSEPAAATIPKPTLCLKVLGSLLKALESLGMDCNNSLGVYSRGSCLLRKSFPEPLHLGQSSLPVPVRLPRPQQSASENSGLDLLPRASYVVPVWVIHSNSLRKSITNRKRNYIGAVWHCKG